MIVTVRYHHENTLVWAESPDVDGFSVAGSTLSEVRELAREGLAFYLEDEDIDLREVTDEGALVQFVFRYGPRLGDDPLFTRPTGGHASGTFATNGLTMPPGVGSRSHTATTTPSRSGSTTSTSPERVPA